MFQKIRLLFVCNLNLNRSPTAAALFANSPYYEARSAGIYARGGKEGNTAVTQGLINWADKIFVMEETQLDFLKEHFAIEGKHVLMLDVPDYYQTSVVKEYEKLTQVLKEKLADYLK